MMTQRTSTIGIYVAEEQEIYRHIYQSSLEMQGSLKLLGISSNGDGEALLNSLASLKPDILLIGTKQFSSELFEQMENVCNHHPHTGIILLMTSAGNDESRSLRKFVQRCKSGVAIYLKQSLDNPEQLHGIITSVSRGQVVLDPSVATSMLLDKTEAPFMKQLTDRELEILNLLSQGYTNQGIAGMLFIDIKTVEHHLNSIYSKLKEDNDLNQRHPRVSVARLYLETTGELMPFNTKTAVSVYPAS